MTARQTLLEISVSLWNYDLRARQRVMGTGLPLAPLSQNINPAEYGNRFGTWAWLLEWLPSESRGWRKRREYTHVSLIFAGLLQSSGFETFSGTSYLYTMERDSVNKRLRGLIYSDWNFNALLFLPHPQRF